MVERFPPTAASVRDVLLQPKKGGVEVQRAYVYVEKQVRWGTAPDHSIMIGSQHKEGSTCQCGLPLSHSHHVPSQSLHLSP